MALRLQYYPRESTDLAAPSPSNPLHCYFDVVAKRHHSCIIRWAMNLYGDEVESYYPVNYVSIDGDEADCVGTKRT